MFYILVVSTAIVGLRGEQSLFSKCFAPVVCSTTDGGSQPSWQQVYPPGECRRIDTDRYSSANVEENREREDLNVDLEQKVQGIADQLAKLLVNVSVLSEELHATKSKLASSMQLSTSLASNLSSLVAENKIIMQGLSDIKEELVAANMELDATKKDLNETKEKLGFNRIPFAAPPKSCNDLRQHGFPSDGVYNITSSDGASEEVFCDMLTSGGGWTLVASIHEDDIAGRCTGEDKWSTQEGVNRADSAWTDNKTFGSIERVTDSDYKSKTYYDLQVSDILIWKVPNGVTIHAARKSATDMYHTSNSFLDQYGGSLAKLYSKVFQKTDKPGPLVYEEASNPSDLLRNMITSVPDWHNYTYDDGILTHINDGGADMYDGGNKVFYRAGNMPFRQVTYGTTEFGDCTYLYRVSSFPYHPFVFFAWIDNNPRTYDSFTVKVMSDAGSDGQGKFISYESYRTLGTTMLKYHSFNIYDAVDPSICGVLFYVYDTSKWGSIPASSFVRDIWTTSTSIMENSVTAAGYPANVFMGYMLLSRTAGKQVTQDQVNGVLDQLLLQLSTVDVTKYNMECETPSAVPIVFDRGSSCTVQSNIPKSSQMLIEPGYIQFGSRASKGGVLALCPGVRVKNCSVSENVCLGGVDLPENETYCGDFAGWHQADSTFLIFVR